MTGDNGIIIPEIHSTEAKLLEINGPVTIRSNDAPYNHGERKKKVRERIIS